MNPRGRLTVKLRVFCKIKEYNIAIVLMSSAINDVIQRFLCVQTRYYFYYDYFFYLNGIRQNVR